MLSQARAAVNNKMIEPYYQPKVDLLTGKAVGFEALLRWRDPFTGLQPPGTIARAFDDLELSPMIGEAMADAVLGDLRTWLDQGHSVGVVAINASATEFRDPRYAENLLARVRKYGVPPAMLELEITETAFLGDGSDSVVEMLQTCRAAGMRIALDDFGTGFSSLSHLRQFPVDVIKIDRSFIADICSDQEDRTIVEAVLWLGTALGMTTVAEGIETREQLEFLWAHRCTIGQGFFFSPPLPASEVVDVFKNRKFIVRAPSTVVGAL